MGRRKQNPEDSVKRALTLKMAGKMFMTQGYSAVSMDALAEAVPVSKRTLYNHFRDKKALFTAVMQDRCQLLFGKLTRRLNENKGVEETLTAIAREFLDAVFAPDALNIYRIAITEARQFPELGKLFYESGPSRAMAFLADYLKKIVAQGELRIANPELAANVFFSMLTNRLQMKCMLGLKKQVSAREKAEIVRYVIEVFLRGQQPD